MKFEEGPLQALRKGKKISRWDNGRFICRSKDSRTELCDITGKGHISHINFLNLKDFLADDWEIVEEKPCEHEWEKELPDKICKKCGLYWLTWAEKERLKPKPKLPEKFNYEKNYKCAATLTMEVTKNIIKKFDQLIDFLKESGG